jgi:TPR repeat protein
MARDGKALPLLIHRKLNLPQSAGWASLAVMHWLGQGVEQNHTAAFELLLKGAQMNNSDCYQVSEGVMCEGVMCEGVH